MRMSQRAIYKERKEKIYVKSDGCNYSRSAMILKILVLWTQLVSNLSFVCFPQFSNSRAQKKVL